jgi:hypothetical protein
MAETIEGADELIARARSVYAECRSYADEGAQTRRFERGAGSETHTHTSELRFKTRWKRPSAFLFEYVTPPHFKTWDAPESSWERYVIWTTPDGPRSWWTIAEKREQPESLGHALGAATGVSGGTASHIPSLLRVMEGPAHWFPSASGFWGELLDHDGRQCLRIPMHVGTDERRLWLERSTGLVLRFDERSEFTAERQRADCFQRVERLRSEMAQDPASASRYGSMLRRFEREAEEQARKLPEPFTSFSSTVYRPRLEPELRDEDFFFVPPS